MTIQIRDAVFETNSSSSHSVTVANDELRDQSFSKETLRAGAVHVTPVDYDRRALRYYLPEGKLAYLAAQAQEAGADSLDTLRTSLRTLTGLDLVVDVGEDGIYVDHQSVGVGLELLADPKRLGDFLFSSSSFVETKSDGRYPGERIASDIGSVLFAPEHRTGQNPYDDEFEITFGPSEGTVEFKAGDFEIDAHADYGDLHAIREAMTETVITFAFLCNMNDDTAVTDDANARDILGELVHEARRTQEDKASLTILAECVVEHGDALRKRKRASAAWADDFDPRPAEAHDVRASFRAGASAATIERLSSVVLDMASRNNRNLT